MARVEVTAGPEVLLEEQVSSTSGGAGPASVLVASPFILNVRGRITTPAVAAARLWESKMASAGAEHEDKLMKLGSYRE